MPVHELAAHMLAFEDVQELLESNDLKTVHAAERRTDHFLQSHKLQPEQRRRQTPERSKFFETKTGDVKKFPHHRRQTIQKPKFFESKTV